MNPATWLQRTASRSPFAPALYEGNRLEASYQQLADRVASLATALALQGVEPGDRVLVFMKNHTRYLEVLYAIWHVGAAVVPVNAKLHPREVAWIAEDSGARLLLCSAAFSDDLQPELNERCALWCVDTPSFEVHYAHSPAAQPAWMDAQAMLWLFYTSGTTGRPKGVMISSANVQAMCASYFTDVDSVEAGDAILYAAPMSHGAGLYNFMHVMRGARHVVPASGGFDEKEILSLSAELRQVSLFAAPTMVRRLVDQAKVSGSEGDGIKTIVYGGGPMYLADIEEAVAQLGPRLVQIYGQGECPMAISALGRSQVSDRTHPRWRERLGSVGVAQSGVEVRIADEHGNFLATGEVGEIVVSGIAVMSGYWRNAAATEATVREGWLWTGDMGRLDEDGFLSLQDRSKDVIISGGSNVYPREVEEVLLQHPAVHEVSVVGRAHPEWGEEVVAFVVRTETCSVDSSELEALCLQHIARFKRPKAYFYEDSLPKNNYGKVLKTALRERLVAS